MNLDVFSMKSFSLILLWEMLTKSSLEGELHWFHEAPRLQMFQHKYLRNTLKEIS